MSVYALESAGTLTASGAMLYGAQGGPSTTTAGDWQLNTSGVTPLGYGADFLQLGSATSGDAMHNAITTSTVDITAGLVVEGTIRYSGFTARGIFVLHPDYRSPTWLPNFSSGADNRQAGWRYAAGAGIWDSAYFASSGMDNYLSDTVQGSTIISNRPSTMGYTSVNPDENVVPEGSAAVRFELVPLSGDSYTLSWTVNEVEQITSTVHLPPQVYVGFGHAGVAGYPGQSRFAGMSITSGSRTSLRSTAPSASIEVQPGASSIEHVLLAPATTMSYSMTLDAAGHAVVPLDTASQGSPELTMAFSGAYELDNPSYGADELAVRTIRGITSRVVVVPTPAVSRGKPFVPDIWIRPPSSVSANVTGWQVVPDPPPPVYVPPPSGPTPVSHRWVAGDAQIAERDWIENWPAVGGGPAWKSLFPYRPRKRPWTFHGSHGRRHTYPAAVIHDPNFVEHLWIDLGSDLAQPYSWVFATVLTSWPLPVQHLLGNGNALARSTISQVRRDRRIGGEPGPDTRMFADRGALSVRTAGSNGIRARSHALARPMVFFGVFNGANSYAGVRDAHSTSIVKGNAPALGNARNWITGRERGWISDQHALKAVTLEIRLFAGRALNPTEMAGQYNQLATAYHFAIT